MNNKIGLIVFFMIFLMVGIAFVSFGVSLLQQGIASQSWYPTDGKIITSNIETHEETHHSDHGTTHSTTYGANIVYQYTVNGINYSSNKVSLGDYSSSDANHAQQIVNRYPVGESVTVYYNPENPSDAVLERGTTEFPYIIIIFGLMPIIVGTVVLYFMLIRKKKGKIEIILDKSVFSPGDIIDGTVCLKLKKPIQASSLKVAFVVEKQIIQRDGNGVQHYNYPVDRLETNLADEKEYHDESYPFQIKIPADILEKAKNFDETGVAYVAGKQIQMGEKTIALQKKAKKIGKWGESMGLLKREEKDVYYVEVHLDVPKKIDIRNKLEINVSNAS